VIERLRSAGRRLANSPGAQLVVGAAILTVAFPAHVSGAIGMAVLAGALGVAVVVAWPHAPAWLRSPPERVTSALVIATVVVAGRRDSDRLRFAGTMGALTVLDDSAVELIQDQTAGRGADLVIDATGTAEAIDLALRAVRRRGRFAAVGMSGQPVVRVPWDLAVSRAVDATFSMSSNGTAWAPARAAWATNPPRAARFRARASAT
jgi:hypothetical protein